MAGLDLKKLLLLLIALALPGLAPMEAGAGILPKDSTEQYELTFWNSIKDSQHPEDYESYLKSYPNGHFAPLARRRIERLRQTPVPPPAATLPVPKKKPKSAPREPPLPVPIVEVPTPPPAVALPPPPIPAPAPLQEVRDCPDCPVLVELPKGLFTMGSDSGSAAERPSHTVSIGTPFAIGKQEVSVGQWQACVEAGGCPALPQDGGGDGDAPVGYVSWDDARQYLTWLQRITGKVYRLPTEAEWEYAARGEGGSFGLLGLDGGASEWVSDCWHDSYRGAPPDGSSWEEPACPARVVRGASWPGTAGAMMFSSRLKHEVGMRNPRNGFRVVREIE